MAPLFDLCHYLLAALAVRADGGLGRSRSHPLATWLAAMSASFAGSLLCYPLLVENSRADFVFVCRDSSHLA